MDVIRLAAAEEALKKNGLRGHVYMTRSAVVWFATKADEANRGIRTSAGPGPLIDAIKRAGESEAETTDWLESLAGDRTRRERTPAEAVWNSPYLVVTGTPARVALAGVLARPATVGPEKLRRLLQEAGTQSIETADKAHRRTAGRPMGATARAEVAAALGKTPRGGDESWLANWLAKARKAREGDSLERLAELVTDTSPQVEAWAYGPATTCGDLEARTEAAGAPETEEGRLWVRADRREGTGSNTRPSLVLRDRDLELERTVQGGEEIAAWIMERRDGCPCPKH